MVRFEEMLKTARIAVTLCAAVKRNEEVLIVTDTNKVRIAEALAKASKEVGAETVTSIMAPRQMHGNEPPKTIAAAMKIADVIFTPTTYAITHTDSMVEALGTGARSIILRGVTEEMMIKGAMTTNYEELRRTSKRLAERLETADTVQVTSDYGTNMELRIDGGPAFILDGFAKEPGVFSVLPGGEVATCPVEGSAEGVLIFDYTMDGIGLLKKPIRLKVEGGRVVEIGGGEQAEELRRIVEASDEGATNIAEFAIGTNPKALLIGNMAEDKKKQGSVHIAIGDNHTLRGTVTSSIHLDGLMVKPTVKLDREIIVQEGRLLL